MATGYGLDGRGLNQSQQGNDFVFLHSIQTDFTAHPASYPTGTWLSFPGGKRSGYKTYHHQLVSRKRMVVFL
jgi:hypothetical protein